MHTYIHLHTCMHACIHTYIDRGRTLKSVYVLRVHAGISRDGFEDKAKQRKGSREREGGRERERERKRETEKEGWGGGERERAMEREAHTDQQMLSRDQRCGKGAVGGPLLVLPPRCRVSHTLALTPPGPTCVNSWRVRVREGSCSLYACIQVMLEYQALSATYLIIFIILGPS